MPTVEINSNGNSFSLFYSYCKPNGHPCYRNKIYLIVRLKI